jgi:hypothetical protein
MHRRATTGAPTLRRPSLRSPTTHCTSAMASDINTISTVQ